MALIHSEVRQHAGLLTGVMVCCMLLLHPNCSRKNKLFSKKQNGSVCKMGMGMGMGMFFIISWSTVTHKTMYQLMGLCYLILLFKFSLNLFSLFFKIMSFYCFLSLKKRQKRVERLSMVCKLFSEWDDVEF